MKQKTIFSAVLISALTVSLASNVTMARGKGGKAHAHHSSGHSGGHASGHRRHGSLFDRIDTDGDSLITEAELVTAKTAKVSRHFNRMDSDGNLFLSQEEYDARTYKRLDRLGIDAEDFEACMVEQLGDAYDPRPTWDELLAAADSDADSLISEAELTSYKSVNAAEKFVALDTGADGYVDEDEFSILLDEKSAEHAARHTCIDNLLEDAAL